MKIAWVIFISLFLSCNQNVQTPKNLLLGEWEGKFKEEKINLTFNPDSSLIISYKNHNHFIVARYKQLMDRLILIQGTSDTVYIKKLDKDNLILRPMEKINVNVDLIFVVDFKKIK
jgi:hypothetical protein